MIREFFVKNFLSIKDEQHLNFVAKGPESELVVKMQDGTLIYKLGILYGANASGKSNMLIALDYIFNILVRASNNEDDPIAYYEPFALSQSESTSMSISFYVNCIRYDYFVEYDSKHILKEDLYYYPNQYKSIFYTRKFRGDGIQADIKFGDSLFLNIKTQERIKENTLNNHSVLSTCSKNTFKNDILVFHTLYDWIFKYYHEVDGDYNRDKSLTDILKNVYSNEKLRKFYTLMLRHADLNINDFFPTIIENPIPHDIREKISKQDIPENVKRDILSDTKDSILFQNTSDNGNFNISLLWQSKGTKKYINIISMLYDMITNNHVYYLDELGEDLHYDLLFYYINAFLYNSNRSQLIITSQETALLSQDFINDNRGLIWFVEKDKNTASSMYKRGDKFGLHKNLSLYNSYRIGKLGAKPELGSFFIDLED